MRSLPLADLHRRAGARLVEVDGLMRLASYGPAAEGALAARANAGLLDLSDRARLAVTGPDRQSWLQGMVTNDVAPLQPGQGCAAAALTSKGKIVGDLRLHLRPEAIWIGAAGPRAAPLITHLGHFIIMEDCAVQDLSAELAELALVGPAAWEIARAVFPELTPLADQGQREVIGAAGAVVAIGWPELGLPGVSFWVAPAATAALWEALRAAGGTPLGFDAAEILRIEAGRPGAGAELDENVIPIEARLEAEINDHKGCYLGQEVIARVTHRGQVNRKLSGFLLSGDVPPLPAPLLHGEKIVGELRSAVRSPTLGQTIGLGYLRRELLTEGTQVTLAGGQIATLTALPFVSAGPAKLQGV